MQISSAHQQFNGDTAPAAPPSGYAQTYFRNGAFYFMGSDGVEHAQRSLSYPHLILFGDAVVNNQFGGFNPTVNGTIIGVELHAGIGPVGSGVTVELGTMVSGTFTPIAGSSATIADGGYGVRVIFGTPIAVTAGVIIRAMVTAIGSTTPGSWLTMRLLFQS